MVISFVNCAGYYPAFFFVLFAGAPNGYPPRSLTARYFDFVLCRRIASGIVVVLLFCSPRYSAGYLPSSISPTLYVGSHARVVLCPTPPLPDLPSAMSCAASSYLATLERFFSRAGGLPFPMSCHILFHDRCRICKLILLEDCEQFRLAHLFRISSDTPQHAQQLSAFDVLCRSDNLQIFY